MLRSCEVQLANVGAHCRNARFRRLRSVEQQRFFSASGKGQKRPRQEDTKGVTATKSADFATWYTQVITRSEMVEYYDVSGCYILRPWSFSIWQQVSRWLDDKIQALGVQNAYFPCFVSQEALRTEEEHLEDFAPEVAWVTKSGTSDLTKPIAIRPTSETIMYPAFAKWIRSYRDLPLQLNQWTNVVRWEFKQPTPFLRTREFLWQEGHTAHATEEEASDVVRTALELYAQAYTDLLALPVIKGVKSSEERFAGSVYTETLEGFIPATGRGIQAATSHYLGQNFARMFGIRFEDVSGHKHFVHQTCWGFTTRCIGIMIMVHGDDKGLVLPPFVAPTQVILIPIPARKDGAGVEARCAELATALKDRGIRCEVDARQTYSPGWKFNWWEMKGVPIRLEVGPKDMAQGTCRLVRRFDGSKQDVDQSQLATLIPAELDYIHAAMLEKATTQRDEGIATVTRWDEVMPTLQQKKLILAPWCESAASEAEIKSRTKEVAPEAAAAGENASILTGAMKSLCIPLTQGPMPPGTKCFVTGEPAKRWALFGRSY
ncbi:proRS [Symbiodinium pilosum]|uniref:proline--tRNA ligase n=1 Tax=Symbiodinium pilosum TaxID=2952 RepID=A0A812WLU8_SYMPI|nr:proRS [Symbiodinium pilosum]